MLEQWMRSEYAIRHPNILKVLMLTLASPIPLSTTEVECTFGLMKLICIRKQLSHKNLSPCMWICNLKLSECDFQEKKR